MKAFLIEEKKEAVALALARVKEGKRPDRTHKHRHHHRSRRDGEDDEDASRRHRRDGRHRRRSHSRDHADHDITKDERRKGLRPSEYADKRPIDYSRRRRSPRRDSQDTAREDFQRDSERSKTGRSDWTKERYRSSRRESP